MSTSPRRNTQRTPRSAPRKAPARKPAAQRRTDAGPPSLSAAHVKGFAAGVIAGVLIGAGGITWLSKQPDPVLSAGLNTEPAPSEQAPRPRFDFYTVLPNQSLDLTSDVEPAELRDQSQSSDLYLLQAGSFRNQQDADRRRGELALLGLEGSIERTSGANGIWYRVYIGPFESRSAMARARSVTAQQSIDTLLLKRPRTP